MSQPLRICMVTTFYPPYNFGGDGIYVQRLGRELAHRGHSVDIVHCVDSYRLFEHDNPSEPQDEPPNVTVHRLTSPFKALSPLATHQSGYPLLKGAGLQNVLREPFDVIHYHNISLVGGPGLLRHGRGIKIMSALDYWLVCQTHVLFRYNRAACTKRHCTACTLSYGRPLQPWRYTGLLKRALRNVDAVIVPSRYSEKVHRHAALGPEIVRIPYFAEPVERGASGNRPSLAEAAGQPYFLFAGRLEKLKGARELVALFRRYRNARLLVAGDGADRARLARIAGRDGNIRLLGRVSREELADLYSGSVAVIVPSLCPEPMPLVTVEAMAARAPVIVRRLGGTHEAVEDSGAGVVYETEDELVSAMDRLLSDPSFRDECADRGYRAYRARWDADAHIGQYLALVRRLLDSRGRAARSPDCHPADVPPDSADAAPTGRSPTSVDPGGPQA